MLTTDDYLQILETCPIKGHDDAIIRALRYIDLGYPVMLYGPPGNGKTSIAEHLLASLGGGSDSFYKIEGTEGMSEYQMIGGFHPLAMSGNSELAERFVYKYGVVARAIINQKNLLIDEFTRAPSSAYSGLFLLLSTGTLSLEYKEKTLLKPDNWVLVVTANFGDEGTYRLSNALKRRFVPVDIGYPSNSTERSLLESITPDLDSRVIDGILALAEETRLIWKKDRGLPQGVSTDGVIRMARYCELSMKQGSDRVSAFMDAAFHQGTIIADETDPHSLHRVQELVVSIGDSM
ncbi:MAG: MoxR family ATPase [Methanosarcinales archaeon]|nr:MoxR family ATPase [Methanosarcinales archaeon]HDJ38796.1 MoxR family ATPase [Methanosarcinales archaeon]